MANRVLSPDTWLHGVVVPLVSPLCPGEEVNEPALRRLIARLLAAGVDGLFVLGSSGEGPALGERERRRVVQVALDEVRARVPVLVGVSDAGTRRTIENARLAAADGADAVVATPPFYFPSSQAEILTHFRRLAENSPIPIVLYNIPRLANATIAADTIARLAQTENVVGLKDSSGDFAGFLTALQIARDARPSRRFAVLQGDETLAGASLLMGADGLVPGLANVVPECYVALRAAAAAADLTAVRAIQGRIDRLLPIYDRGTIYGALKAALESQGIPAGGVTEPLRYPTATEAEEIRLLLREEEPRR